MGRKLICLVSFVLVLIVAQSASADLVGHWLLDGDGTDASGNGLDGTINGNVVPTADRSGSPDSAMLFGGASGDNVDIGDPPELQLTGAMTLAAWVMLDGTNTNNARIFAKAGGGGARSWSLNIEASSGGVANPATFQISADGAANISISDSDPLPTDEWVHMAGVYRPGEATEVYVNGELKASNTTGIPTRQFSNNSRTVLIGSRNNCGNCGWLGSIDDVRIYAHALSELEILSVISGEPQPYAFRPDPSDGAIHEATWVSVSWRAGDSAVSHDVYLGDNFDDVEQATQDSDLFRLNQTDTFYLAGFPGYAYPEGLVPGTAYYWRIDEVNDADPGSPWKGSIWSFSIPPKSAYGPDPADGAEFMGPDNVTLSWIPGFGAKMHTVFLADDFDDVNAATVGAAVGSAAYNPGLLESEKVYYWRVDEFDGIDTHKGDIWGFTTPGAAGNPQPVNSAPDVPMTATLNWTPADNAASHELYFGVDKDAVKNATTASPEYVGSIALGSESYDPGKLAWDSAYYWRVDAVYPTETLKGLVWRFETADFILVDDFESYNDIDPAPGEPGINRIFDKWIDGFGTTTNGALVGNDLPPYAEQTIVHGGAQSMIYRYDNAGKTSEATFTLVNPRDWTAEGVTKLGLWVRGYTGNAADRVFVALNGTAVVYHDDANATQMAGWTEWVSDLAAFGVNLTNVNTITIGVGAKNAPAPGGGQGTLYFDDIRLYR